MHKYSFAVNPRSTRESPERETLANHGRVPVDGNCQKNVPPTLIRTLVSHICKWPSSFPSPQNLVTANANLHRNAFNYTQSKDIISLVTGSEYFSRFKYNKVLSFIYASDMKAH